MRHEDALSSVMATCLIVCVGIGPRPECAVAALTTLLAYRVFDKLAQNSRECELQRVSRLELLQDERTKAIDSSIAAFRADLLKIKGKQDQSDIKAAFGGRNA